MFVQFFIPFTVLVICYGKIVWMLTRRINIDLITDRSMGSNTEQLSDTSVKVKAITKDEHKNKFQLARRNTIKTLLLVGLCFIICWSQNQVLYLMYHCGYDLNFNSTYLQVTILVVFCNCTVNPFIYVIEYRDYQEALKIFLHCIINGHQGSNSVRSSSLHNSNQTIVSV